MLRRVRRWTTAPDSLSSRSLGEPGVVPAPGPILRAGISVGRVFRRAPRPPTLRRGESGRQGELGGAQAVVADRNVRMVAPRTGPNRLSGTLGARFGRSRGSPRYSDRAKRPVPLQRARPDSNGGPAGSKPVRRGGVISAWVLGNRGRQRTCVRMRLLTLSTESYPDRPSTGTSTGTS